MAHKTVTVIRNFDSEFIIISTKFWYVLARCHVSLSTGIKFEVGDVTYPKLTPRFLSLPFSRQNAQQNSWGQGIVAVVEWWGVGVVNLAKKRC